MRVCVCACACVLARVCVAQAGLGRPVGKVYSRTYMTMLCTIYTSVVHLLCAHLLCVYLPSR
jgi:hypothetical protein